jgi:transposase
MITRHQYQTLIKEHNRKAIMSRSADKAGISRPTARKYLKACTGPETSKSPRSWRTRKDPFAVVWLDVERMLKAVPELEAWTIFEYLKEKYPHRFEEGQLRTFQRRVRSWKLEHGPEKEVFFPQVVKPGQRMQVDWTSMNSLKIRVGGKLYPHLLCHFVLPYSNWEWATRCLSESQLSLRSGLQQALTRLGGVPEQLWIDHSSTATHRLSKEYCSRGFTQEFLDLCAHFGLAPRAINVASPNENGDVESSHQHLYNRIDQYLLLRGHRDFDEGQEYDDFLVEVLIKANGRRTKRIAEELSVLRALPDSIYPEYREYECRVSSSSTIRVNKVAYSVPSRLIGVQVRVRMWETHLQICEGKTELVRLPRQCGDRGARIDFRHVIEHLLRKPGAFAQYRWRRELFPSMVFQVAHEHLERQMGSALADREYLKILKLAADQGQAEVEMALELLFSNHRAVINQQEVLSQIETMRQLEQEALLHQELKPSLAEYDQLLEKSEVSHEI